MDIEERLKKLPPDGEMKICTERQKDFKTNIMIIRCPDHMRGPDDRMFHLATVDRSIPGTEYSGDTIIDQLCPGLGKVKLLVEEEPEIDSPPNSSPPPPPKKYTGGLKHFHKNRRGNRHSSGGRTRSYHKKPQIQKRKDQSWTERNEKPRIDRTGKSWMERPVRSTADDICPWEDGKQPWNNALGNIQIPPVPVFSDRFGFGHHKDVLPLPSDYPHTSAIFHRVPSPTFKPTIKGLLGDHPYENDPGHSYLNHNPNSDPLNNTFPSVPRDSVIGNDYRNSNPRNSRGSDLLNNTFPSVPRDSVIGNDYRNSNPRNSRGSFKKKSFFEREPFVHRTPFQNDVRNSEASIWNGDVGARHNNKTRGQNRNRRGNSFNRRGQNYRPRRGTRN